MIAPDPAAPASPIGEALGGSWLRTAVWAAILAGTLVGAGVLVAVYLGGARHLFALAGVVPGSSWALLAAATAVFFTLDYVRFSSLLAMLGHRLRYRVGLQLACVSYFVTSLTPNSELHTPAMIYVLHQEGVPAPKGAAASLVKSIYMMFWICVFAFVTLQLAGRSVLPPEIASRVALGSLGLLVPASILAALALFPERIQAFAAKWAERSSSPRARRIIDGAARTGASIATLGRSRDPRHLAAHAASIAFVLVYVFIGHTACAAMGIALSWTQSLVIFSNSLFIAYFAPVPGSIGVTELLTAYLIDPDAPPRAVAAALLLRTCCWYSVLLPGAAILIARTWRVRRG